MDAAGFMVAWITNNAKMFCKRNRYTDEAEPGFAKNVNASGNGK